MVASESTGTRNGSWPHSPSSQPAGGEFPPGDPKSGARVADGAEYRSDAPPSESDPLVEIAAHLAEAREFLSHFLSAKADQFRLQASRIVVWCFVGLIAGVAGAAAIVTAAALLVDGFAHGLAVLFGGRLWAGELVAGGVCLGMAALVLWLGVRKIFQISQQRTVAKYARRHTLQQFKFGFDASRGAARNGAADGGCAPGA